MPHKRTIERTCLTCTSVFLAEASIVARGKALFCSPACANKGQQAKSTIELLGDRIARIPLTTRDGHIQGHAIIDDSEAAWATQWKWHLSGKDGYAVRTEQTHKVKRTIRMHRELLGLKPGDGLEGDHINRNRLDNRRINLRAIPKLGNRQNRSRDHDSSSSFRGVSWHAKSRTWRATVTAYGQRYSLGCFTEEDKAAEAARSLRMKLMPYAID